MNIKIKYKIIVTITSNVKVKIHNKNLITGNHSLAETGNKDIIELTTVLPTK